MAITASPEASLERLKQLANAIHQHADDQQWDDLPQLIAQFNHVLRSGKFTREQAKFLGNILSTVNDAIELAQQRRDEIGRLVSALARSE